MQPTSILTAALIAASNVKASGYIAFYSDSGCKHQVGSKHYSMSNTGCFSNGGHYMQVVSGQDDPTKGNDFVLTQTKEANCNGGTQNTVTYDGGVHTGCHNLGGDGFLVGGDGEGNPYSIRQTPGPPSRRAPHEDIVKE